MLLFCGLAAAAQALQIGETRAQLLARHGAPGTENSTRNVAIYSWDGWSAEVVFENDAVHKLTYRRNWYLGESEITSLLHSNGGIARWREGAAGEGKTRQWRRDDGALASCQTQGPLSMTFQIASPATPATPAATAAPTTVATKPPTPAPTAAPKIVVTATPQPVPSTPPTFPKLLGDRSEPESPVPEESAPEPVLTPAVRSLPQLRTEEIPSPTPPKSVKPTPEPAPIAASPKPETIPAPAVPVAAPAKEPSSADTATPAKRGSGGIIFGALVFCGFLAGAAFLLRKLMPVPIAPRRATFAPEPARPAPRGPAPDFGKLRGDQFELLVGEIYRRQGCTVELSAALGQGDNIDLTLRRDSETILVQCKHWQAPRVAEREMREFYGAMASTGAPHGIMVTTGAFTRDALEFAEGKGIDLIDGAALQDSMARVARPGENLLDLSGWVGEFAAHAHVFDPECPACQGMMAIRSNRINGAQIWACRSYPRCPGKREPRRDLLAVAASH